MLLYRLTLRWWFLYLLTKTKNDQTCLINKHSKQLLFSHFILHVSWHFRCPVHIAGMPFVESIHLLSKQYICSINNLFILILFGKEKTNKTERILNLSPHKWSINLFFYQKRNIRHTHTLCTPVQIDCVKGRCTTRVSIFLFFR